jgi:transketolase
MNREFNPAVLQETARKLRVNIIKMTAMAGSGHPSTALSAVEIVTYLYFYKMRINPNIPRWEDRDRFVLSKGHGAPVIYAALAERGFFPENALWTLRDVGSILQGHPDMKKTPGVDMTTGSLGQGISCAVGIALGGKHLGKGFKVYVMVGDGELQSGQVWEAAMFAGHYKLDNLVAIVDDNKQQTDGLTKDIVDVHPIASKFSAFGWETTEIDGHDFAQIHKAFERSGKIQQKPFVIVADTVKGRGVKAMETSTKWHGRPPAPEEAEAFIKEITGGRIS